MRLADPATAAVVGQITPDLAVAVGDLLDSQDSSVLHAQSVDNRSQTQSGHDLVAEGLAVTSGNTADLVQSGEAAVVAEQRHAVAAPVFKLTLPGLSPIMFYTLVVNIIQAFQSFGQVKILTQGGPGESTNLIVYSIYRDAFFNYRFGSAAAQSVVLFLIVMALTLVMFRMEKRGVKY